MLQVVRAKERIDHELQNIEAESTKKTDSSQEKTDNSQEQK